MFCTILCVNYIQMVEMDTATMMLTLAVKGGASHTREVSLAAHGDSFQAYSTRNAGPVEDTTGLEVSVHALSTFYNILPFHAVL